MKKEIFIYPKVSIKEALKRLDETSEKTLIVIDKEKHLLGTITDGDIRRYILRTGEISGIVEEVYNKNPIFVSKGRFCEEEIKDIFIQKKIEVLPIIDENNKVVDYLTWSLFFSEHEKKYLYKSENVNVPVVIMAGGRGTRLSPFTQVLPKPLIPIRDKTIVEHIIDNFRFFGVRKFFLTLNYKGEMIEAYFKGIDKDYEVEFVWEKNFLGTAGSLKLLDGKIKGNFVVSNCDVLIRADFSEILKFHKDKQAVFTSITAIKHYKIPYGIVNMRNGGLIDNIEEKPEYTFQINTGVYILHDSVLKYIPEDHPFNMPDLIKKLLRKGKRVMGYPVNESSYVDIGQWEEYRKALINLGG